MARPGYAKGVGGPKTLTFVLWGPGPLAAFDDAITLRARMPERGTIIGMTLDVAATGGTHADSAIDVLNGATSILATPFDVDALTPGTPVDKEGTDLVAAQATVAKDAELRIATAETGGTAPTVRGVVLTIDYVPLGN